MPYPPHDFTFIPTKQLTEDQRWSTWSSVDKTLCHGPEPRPGWVVTDDGAVDTELGVLKTGKEADVFLLDRSVPEDPARTSILAAKRYRSSEHRQFHRDAAYVEGRRTRKTRDARAMAKRTRFGRAVAAGQWAFTEFDALKRLWSAGVPVPYPVQIDGTEILMEFIGSGREAAPRLAQVRPGPDLLAEYFDQLRRAMRILAGLQLAHGDLSAYNILADGERLVIIDVPQVVDVVANPSGSEFLLRDCHNVCRWFASRGLEVDPEELLADLLSYAW